MMRKQNKGSDFLPMQTRKNSELSIILTSLIFHCELAMINFCPRRSSTCKWVVLRRELGRNAVDGKSVAVGIGVGYQEDPRWAKKSTPPVRGGFWKKHLSCVLYFELFIFEIFYDCQRFFWNNLCVVYVCNSSVKVVDMQWPMMSVTVGNIIFDWSIKIKR